MTNEPQWLIWARQIQAIAQTGQHYTRDGFDRERYQQLESLATEIISSYTDEMDAPAIEQILATEDGYATPKVDVRGVVFNAADEILLVRENLDGGKWTLPGGWADVNVTPSENVAREVLEEAGYRVQASKLLAFLDRRLHGHPPYMFHIYKLYMQCNLLDENPVPSPQGDLESSEARWFAESDLPPDEQISIGRVTHKLLKRFFEHYRHPEWATDYD